MIISCLGGKTLDEFDAIVAEKESIQAAKDQVEALKAQLEAAKASLEAQNAGLEANKAMLEENKVKLEGDLMEKQKQADFVIKAKEAMAKTQTHVNDVRARMKNAVINKQKSSNASLTQNVDELKAYLKTMEDDLAAQRDLTAAIEAELRAEREVRITTTKSLYTNWMVALQRIVDTQSSSLAKAKVRAADAEQAVKEQQAILDWELNNMKEVQAQRQEALAALPVLEGAVPEATDIPEASDVPEATALPEAATAPEEVSVNMA